MIDKKNNTGERKLISLVNYKGPSLVQTNWWSEGRGSDMFLLTGYSGCLRLLVPPPCEGGFLKMKSRENRLVVYRDESDNNLGYPVGILIEDGSESSLTINLSRGQVDNLPPVASVHTTYLFEIYVNRGGPRRILHADVSLFDVPELPWRHKLEELYRSMNVTKSAP